MFHLDHTAFVNACRDEPGVGHHTLPAYAQDLLTFARFTKDHELADPLSKTASSPTTAICAMS